jgi:aspartyl-tRNA synthetase
MSVDMLFLVFRQQIRTMQGVLQREKDGRVSEEFIRWSGHLQSESLVHVEGHLRKPPQPVTGCTIHEVEIAIDNLYLLVPVDAAGGMDAEAVEKAQDEERMNHYTSTGPSRNNATDRIVSLRTPAMQCIFRIKSGVCNAFRSALDEQGFIEIHTPKLQPAATESGAEVFKLNYFGRMAFLAQSPQLSKQMAISADFSRVYEVAPVFRGENSNTHRHMTEYIGLDLEMEIQHDYYEAMDVIDEMFKRIFEQVYKIYHKEIAIVKEKFPHDDLVWLERTPRITFKEGIDLLNSSGWTDESGNQASPLEDMGTKAERRLGELVKKKYKTDYYILDKFPTAARPFYTKLDADNKDVTNSFDIFIRGQEITTGGQRINDPHELAARMKESGVDPHGLSEYFQSFRLAMPPHAGCGIGLERVIFLLLNLGDIRCASLFPRDPKSLPQKRETQSRQLRHPEADTLRYTFAPQDSRPEMPTLEDLIANYGDSTNTSWLDERYTVWRDSDTGACVGYAIEGRFAVVMGNPLCDKRQYRGVIGSFLHHVVQEQGLNPIWLLASAEVEEILGNELTWRTLSCIAEERVNRDSSGEKGRGKKERQAENAKVKVHEIEAREDVQEELRDKFDKRIADWKSARQGVQVHITDVRPWVDMQHRRYFWAEDQNNEIAGLVVLAQLAPEHGYQIKYALDFPGATSGSIEALISRAIETVRGSGVSQLTFGARSTAELQLQRNITGMKGKMVRYMYSVVSKQLKLSRKSGFRQKFGVTDDPLYICYPFLGLGLSGMKAVVKVFKEDS